MTIENPGIDDDEEIGLTEDEIREIAGDTDLDMAMSQTETLGAERDRMAEDGLEEIDFSDLGDEMEGGDGDDSPILELDDSLESEIAKLKIEDSIESTKKAFHEIGNKYYKDEVLSSAPAVTKPMRSHGTSVSSGGRAGVKSAGGQKISKVANPPNKKMPQARGQSPATRLQPASARASKPDGIMNNPQELRALFQCLDEMLAQLPQEKIKQFAFSKEYEYYFEILKKLGI